MNPARRFTWNHAATVAAIAAALQLWDLFELVGSDLSWDPEFESRLLSRTLIIATTVAVVAIATLRADDRVARGEAPMLAYGTAVVAGTALAASLQFGLHLALGLPTEFDESGPSGLALVQPVRVFMEFLLWSTAIVVVHASLRRQVLAAARMKAAQFEHARMQRRAAEASLQALQAQIEPQLLFATIEQVRQRYGVDPAGGGRLLDDLVAYLRAALPQRPSAGSSLAHELEVARTALALRQECRGLARSRFLVDASAAALAARMPPMVLAPLIERVFGAGPTGPDRIGVGAALAGRELQVEITASTWVGLPARGSAALGPVADRLQGLYGDQAKVEWLALPDYPVRLTLSIPHDTTDSPHR